MVCFPGAGFHVVHMDRDGDILIQFNNAQTLRWVQQKDFVKMMAETKLKVTQPTNSTLHQVRLDGIDTSQMCQAQIWSVLEQTQVADVVLDLYVEGTTLFLVFPTGETARQGVKIFNGRHVDCNKVTATYLLAPHGKTRRMQQKATPWSTDRNLRTENPGLAANICGHISEDAKLLKPDRSFVVSGHLCTNTQSQGKYMPVGHRTPLPRCRM